MSDEEEYQCESAAEQVQEHPKVDKLELAEPWVRLGSDGVSRLFKLFKVTARDAFLERISILARSLHVVGVALVLLSGQ